MKIKDLTNMTFDGLKVISRASDYVSPRGKHLVRWNCKCDCGNFTIVNASYLLSGHTKSCGCSKVTSNVTHGMSRTRLYKIWDDMVSRCTRESHKSFKDYGGRGITVCKEWLHDFNAFKEWALTNGYDESLTIDRISVNGNYEPYNCRWITMKAQQNNRRNNNYISYDGETKTLTEWSEVLGINNRTLHNRIYRSKWSINDAFTIPVGTIH